MKLVAPSTVTTTRQATQKIIQENHLDQTPPYLDLI